MEQQQGQEEDEKERARRNMKGKAKIEEPIHISDSTPSVNADNFSSPLPGQDYRSQATTKHIAISLAKVDFIIGREGEMLKCLESQSGANIKVFKDSAKVVGLRGSPDQISIAEQLINEVITEVKVKIPHEKVCDLIGIGGESLKKIKETSGAQLKDIVIDESTVIIHGLNKQVDLAIKMITEVVGEDILISRNKPSSYAELDYSPADDSVLPELEQQPPPGCGYDTHHGAYHTQSALPPILQQPQPGNGAYVTTYYPSRSALPLQPTGFNSYAHGYYGQTPSIAGESYYGEGSGFVHSAPGAYQVGDWTYMNLPPSPLDYDDQQPRLQQPSHRPVLYGQGVDPLQPRSQPLPQPEAANFAQGAVHPASAQAQAAASPPQSGPAAAPGSEISQQQPLVTADGGSTSTSTTVTKAGPSES